MNYYTILLVILTFVSTIFVNSHSDGYNHPDEEFFKTINEQSNINSNHINNNHIDKNSAKNLFNIEKTTPTIMTNYIGKWTPLYADEKIYIFTGFGSTINTENERLSSKRLERMIAYAYIKNDTNKQEYNAYFESIPHDGSYWHLTLTKLSMGYYKYTIKIL